MSMVRRCHGVIIDIKKTNPGKFLNWPPEIKKGRVVVSSKLKNRSNR
ncbi:MAG: hypothetical protein GX362_06870 [Methanosarcinaceae archaeon]|nr:hypothetical protein [Methanosarcinaceae archaeon]